MMEVSIFPKHEKLLKKTVEVRLHTDHTDEKLKTAFTALQKQMAGKLALPIYVLVHPDRPKTIISKFEGADPPSGSKFSKWLEDAVESADES
ncbi:MAG: hypothetical protein VX272_01160 [Planctomycetota bacterium]|nr:hypothetical protein [Planctomycetota bacterium]